MILTQHHPMPMNQFSKLPNPHRQQISSQFADTTKSSPAPLPKQISLEQSVHRQRLHDIEKPPPPTMNGYRKRRATSPACKTVSNASHVELPGYHSDNAAGPLSHDRDTAVEVSRNGDLARAIPQVPAEPQAAHVVQLSGIEHCMPRAYIRVCLAYRVPDSNDIAKAIRNLNIFIRKIVNAKPYLAGHVLPKDTDRSIAEIRFTNEGYEQYPDVEVGELLDESGRLMDYDELNALGFPPSKLHPDKVAKLPEQKADEKMAPALGVRANIVKGGLIVSFYLHHFISDGTGLGLLLSGSVTDDLFTFARHPEGHTHQNLSLWDRLHDFAAEKTRVRKRLTCELPDLTTPSRTILYNRRGVAAPSNKPGRGCVFSIPDKTVELLRDELSQHVSGPRFSRHDALQAFIWRHMTKARMYEVKESSAITTSKLQIPVNIRSKISPILDECYFGAAVDFATAELDLTLLVKDDTASLAVIASAIRTAIKSIDEAYIRQAIAVAMLPDPTIDVEDLMGANMNRVTGADMYITSWERLELYDATLDMGIGRPEWVRKPWSRDPGSCIILPRNGNKSQYEIVVQMKARDMDRLLGDKEFMQNISGFTE